MNKALLLDRDGVINKEITYLHRIEDFEFIYGVFEACRVLGELEYLIIIITNQAGIGRGYYTEDDFRTLNDWMVGQFKDHGTKISEVYCCPFHASEGIGHYKIDSYDRKPNPGMIFKARDDFDLDLGASVLVGDKETDIQAGRTAGVGTNILVKSGHAIEGESKADLIIDSIKQLPAALNRRNLSGTR